MSQAQDVLAVAHKYVAAGYKEGANNDSIFGKWYGLNNQSWCAMFVSYCFDQAKVGNLLVGAQSPKGFAYCPAGVNYFKAHNQLVPVKQAQPGDIVFFNWNGGKDAEHVGLVVYNDSAHGILDTYEGNTGAPGLNQSNGDGCYEKRRLYQFVVAVARPKWTA